MTQLPGLHLRASHPQICATLRGETIEDLSEAVRALSEYPADVIEFNAASFNGVSNFSQIGNALLLVTSPLRDQRVIFSCPMNELPDYYQTPGDYHDILFFAIRTGLIDAVEIEASLAADTIDELADEAAESDIVPILTIRYDEPFSESSFADTLFAAVSDDIFAYHIICSLDSDEQLAELMECIHSCKAAHEDAQFIIETKGAYGKTVLKKGNTLSSPLLYAAPEETEDRLSVAELHNILQSK